MLVNCYLNLSQWFSVDLFVMLMEDDGTVLPREIEANKAAIKNHGTAMSSAEMAGKPGCSWWMNGWKRRFQTIIIYIYIYIYMYIHLSG